MLTEGQLAATLEALSVSMESSAASPDERVYGVLRALGQGAGADRVSLFSVDPARGQVYRRSMWAATAESAASATRQAPLARFCGRYGTDHGATPHVYRMGALEGAPAHIREIFERRGLTALARIPLLDDLGPRGVVSVHWRATGIDPITTVHLTKLVSQFLANELVHASNLDSDRIKELALDHTSDVVCVVRADGHFVYLNAAGRRLGGIPLSGPVSGQFWDHLPADEAARLREVSAGDLRSEDRWSGDLQVVGADGRERSMETITHVHRDPAGRARFLSAILRDVTERNATERRLRAMIGERDRFVATVSHELRTPLTAVLGIVTELVESPERFADEEASQLLSLVRTQANEMADIVSDLLVMARLESDNVAIKSEILDLRAEVEGVTALLGLAAEISGSGIVVADAGRVRQIVRNLLTNAQRYGGPNIAVSLCPAPGGVALRVSDDGPGIPQADAERVFVPYERIVRTDTESGLGLGLFVSRSLARLMGGDLTLLADRAHTTFELTLPPPPPYEPGEAGE